MKEREIKKQLQSTVASVCSNVDNIQEVLEDLNGGRLGLMQAAAAAIMVSWQIIFCTVLPEWLSAWHSLLASNTV